VGNNSTISGLERRVFKYDSSKADKRFFKQKIVDFVREKPDGKSYTQYLIDAIWLRNNKGETTKYMYFNDRIQQLFIDRYFYSWARKMIGFIEEEAERAYGKNTSA